MPRVARSDQPLYQTRGRALSFPVRLTNPDGSAIDLTGSSAEASLRWSGVIRPLAVGPLDATGKPIITGAVAATAGLPLGRVSELTLSVTDSLGVVTDYVWPVVGEDL